ncbi:MAG TPA: ATP-binding protein, partial [Thermoanaerobaculia bacterium]|nr:ATP-binding protein [Thermoanaerobaculia bacterium]
MRLSTRLVLLFLLLALVLAPSLGTLVFFSARRALTEVIAREEENEGAAIALAIDREIYKAMLDVENIAANHHAAASITAPAGADLTASEAELVRESRTSGPWDLVSIAGSDGVVRLSTERRRVGAELGGKEREVFARALRDGFAYSDLVTLPDAPRPTLILAHRITANEGPKQGSIVGCVVARYSWPAAAQILNAADMRARIVNSRGETIAYVGEDLRDRSREMGMEHPLVRRKQPGALVEYSTSEGAMMGTLAVEPGYLRYRGNGWMVIVESPRALVQRPITQLAQRTVVVVLLITALSALLFASVARRLTVPIRELTGTAAAVRGGDLSVRASVSTRDEVGELATTFNEMLSTIDQQIAERRQSEAFLASVLDNIPIAVFVSDVRDSKIVRVNAATAAIAGRAPQEFIGRSASDLFPREAAAIREFEKRAIAAGYLEGEGVFALPHGRRRIRTREILIRTAEGAPRYLLGLSEDVTEEFERKRRQSFRLTVARIVSEHGEAGEVLSLLLDAVRDVFHWAVGLVWVPRRERDVLRVAALSPREGFESIAAASGTAQIARDEGVIGEVWGEGTPRWLENVANEPRYTRARAAAADRLKTAIAVPIAVGTEVLGVIELLDVHERPRDEGFLSFLEEVSTQIGHFLIRVRAEEELRRAKAAADEANRAKSDFLARMSHEIRTPLNGVVGMTSLLSRTPLTREQQEFVRTARSSANLLLSVINGILDFSKIEAGKLTLEEVDFSLREVVIEAIKPLATRADDAGVELIVRIDPGVPDALRGDALRLRQVLINLVGNAVKFTPAGEIVVSAAVEEERESELIMRFSVSDTGIGIPSDRLTSIFSAFEQADASTTRRFGGTGLGLAISERLVEMMGGSIRVESEEGKGSTFHFTVSLKRQEAPATMPP